MKLLYHLPSEKRIKINSYQFLLDRFWLIMEIKFYDEDGCSLYYKEERVKDMKNLILEYRNAFLLKCEVYSNVQIWKIISRKYYKWWDDLHHDYSDQDKKGINRTYKSFL